MRPSPSPPPLTLSAGPTASEVRSRRPRSPSSSLSPLPSPSPSPSPLVRATAWLLSRLDAWSCKVFVDCDAGTEALLDLLARRCGRRAGQSTIVALFAEIDVRRNDHHVEPARRGDADDFVQFSCYIDLVPTGSVDREGYLAGVAALRAALREGGWPAVAACNFEDELRACGAVAGNDPGTG